MEHQILNLFPLSIYKSKLGLTDEYKKELINLSNKTNDIKLKRTIDKFKKL